MHVLGLFPRSRPGNELLCTSDLLSRSALKKNREGDGGRRTGKQKKPRKHSVSESTRAAEVAPGAQNPVFQKESP